MKAKATIQKWGNSLAFIFKEKDLLKGLTAHKAHADVLAKITIKEFNPRT
jgi:antitoxin component of MazEF toxin-antitoxin module